MYEPADSPDRDQVMLAELAELDLTLAKRMHACAMAAEDPAQVCDLSRAYQRIARSLRQTLALKAQLKRARDTDARANPPPPAPRDEIRIHQRMDEVRTAVQRVIWDEEEGGHADDLYAMLNQRLHQLARNDELGHRDLDQEVAAICASFGLTAKGAAKWRDLPDAVFAEDDEEEVEDESRPHSNIDWRSSA